MFRKALLLLPSLFLLAGCAWMPWVETEAEKVAATSLTRVGDQAPDFTLPLIEGGEFTLGAQKGKVVLVNWWATWCPPCLEEIPHLQAEVWERFSGPNFSMLSVSREETPEVVSAFVREHGMAWPQAVDPDRGAYGRYAEAYIPRNYVIDAKGRIVFQSSGYEPEEFAEMVAAIETALAEVPLTP